MSEITRDEVKKVAQLAHLHIEESELDGMAGTLTQILGAIDKLAEVDTDGIEPTSQSLSSENVFREDLAEKKFGDVAMDNAPAADENHFSVPRVVEQ